MNWSGIGREKVCGVRVEKAALEVVKLFGRRCILISITFTFQLLQIINANFNWALLIAQCCSFFDSIEIIGLQSNFID